MEKIFTCIKNIGVWHSFEKMKKQLCFFLKKPFLVITTKVMYIKNLRLLSVYKQMYHICLYEDVLGNFEDTAL